MFDWADPIFDGIAAVLAWFYSLVPDYTFAICMLTLAIMLVFTPLTLRGARSMTKMQALQPELSHLKKKHAGDRMKLNEEMMELYRANGVSPLGGCLPNLVQIPIFIVLYRVIWNLRIPDDNPIDNPFPRNLSSDSQLYQDIVAAGGEMRSLGMDLSEAAKDVVQADFVEGLPYLALIAVTFVLAWLQQRQMMARRGAASMPNRQMEMLMKYLPFMLPVFSFFVPAALVPYFIVSSVYRMLTQAFIHATMKPPQSLASNSASEVIDTETVSEPDPPRAVPNQRSRKALDAEAARQAERERRSAERRAGERQATSSQAPNNEAASSRDADKQASSDQATDTGSAFVRRTRASSSVPEKDRQRARAGRASASKRQKSDRGTKRGRAPQTPESRPIQSRRTSGDGKTRNRRKR